MDYPNTKETQERISQRKNQQTPQQQPSREINHTSSTYFMVVAAILPHIPKPKLYNGTSFYASSSPLPKFLNGMESPHQQPSQ
jgi:hypothetical protein